MKMRDRVSVPVWLLVFLFAALLGSTSYMLCISLVMFRSTLKRLQGIYSQVEPFREILLARRTYSILAVILCAVALFVILVVAKRMVLTLPGTNDGDRS